VLWRHGRTSWNVQQRFQGHLDIGLDELGRAQARGAALLLARLQPHIIVSSDLDRAATTAGFLAAATGQPVAYDPMLRETHGGAWQGRTPDELSPDERADYDEWRGGAAGSRPPGGESREEVAERVCVALERAVAALPDGGTVVAVTHGGAARVGIAQLLGLPSASWSAIGGLGNCCWSVLSRSARSGPWRLDEHNAGTLPEVPVVEEG
jgi:probable phosphoglycerate mutase